MQFKQLKDGELYKISSLAICIVTNSEGTELEILASKIVDLCLEELADRSENKKQVLKNSNGGMVIKFERKVRP